MAANGPHDGFAADDGPHPDQIVRIVDAGVLGDPFGGCTIASREWRRAAAPPRHCHTIARLSDAPVWPRVRRQGCKRRARRGRAVWYSGLFVTHSGPPAWRWGHTSRFVRRRLFQCPEACHGALSTSKDHTNDRQASRYVWVFAWVRVRGWGVWGTAASGRARVVVRLFFCLTSPPFHPEAV